MLKEKQRYERAADLRAGLVAAAVYNTHLKKGRTPYQPTDFVREPRREEDFLTPKQSMMAMDAWATAANAAIRKERTGDGIV